ncbi:hypothetical protein BP5796_03128 [Coleophoma crateriformis]|uniref:Uncharacterized protein n=1 Tax=Coleophoma crateriformis TaxID=565419 RepID=A0A3D8SMM4_9HELO|nr:hypothetical protein BP5796_03128 [Coleophoma crateriformis]
MAPSSTFDTLDYLLAIFIPPIAVFLKTGCNADFLINICLTVLGWIPGVILVWKDMCIVHFVLRSVGGFGQGKKREGSADKNSDAWYVIGKHDPAKRA